jgi:toxin ParE1/3/4
MELLPMKVKLSGSATAELKAIARYIARDNIARAKSFSKELRLECQKLGKHPARFIRVTGYDNVRKRAYGNYLIYYRVAAESVEIIHIFHGAMAIDEADLDLAVQNDV